MKKPQKTQQKKQPSMVIRIEGVRPRNPFHDVAATQRAGSHEKGDKAKRRAEKQGLQRLLREGDRSERRWSREAKDKGGYDGCPSLLLDAQLADVQHAYFCRG
jgi:hypothetical protein